ncbi:MAG: hypothetical protein IKS63_00650 [Firmicutes bacterium]|nr:hypothetical protein [Bacillota bacterium]
MKKKLLLAVVCIMLMSFGIAMTGCESGETYDAGNISCTVPDGWKALSSEELFNTTTDSSGEETASEEDADPNSIYLYKGIEKTEDILNANGITILYLEDYTFGGIDEMKAFYENVKKQKPLKLENYEWNWYTGEQMDGTYKYAILETVVDDDDSIQINVVLKNGDKTISMDDKDVKAILESVKITKSDK